MRVGVTYDGQAKVFQSCCCEHKIMPPTHHARTLDRQCRCCQNINPIPDELDELSGSVGYPTMW